MKKTKNEPVKVKQEELNWDDLKTHKNELAKNIIFLQQTCVELLELHKDADKTILDKTHGLTLTLKDLAIELRDVGVKYELDAKSGLVTDKDDGYLVHLDCMYALVGLDEKLLVLNGDTLLDIITSLTDNNELQQSTKMLKQQIKDGFKNDGKQ